MPWQMGMWVREATNPKKKTTKKRHKNTGPRTALCARCKKVLEEQRFKVYDVPNNDYYCDETCQGEAYGIE